MFTFEVVKPNYVMPNRTLGRGVVSLSEIREAYGGLPVDQLDGVVMHELVVHELNAAPDDVLGTLQVVVHCRQTTLAGLGRRSLPASVPYADVGYPLRARALRRVVGRPLPLEAGAPVLVGQPVPQGEEPVVAVATPVVANATPVNATATPVAATAAPAEPAEAPPAPLASMACAAPAEEEREEELVMGMPVEDEDLETCPLLGDAAEWEPPRVQAFSSATPLEAYRAEDGGRVHVRSWTSAEGEMKHEAIHLDAAGVEQQRVEWVGAS